MNSATNKVLPGQVPKTHKPNGSAWLPAEVIARDRWNRKPSAKFQPKPNVQAMPAEPTPIESARRAHGLYGLAVETALNGCGCVRRCTRCRQVIEAARQRAWQLIRVQAEREVVA